MTLSARTKNVNNPGDAFPTAKCRNSILTATLKATGWTDVCNLVTRDALAACRVGLDKAFKVTCAVYKQDAFKYHSSYKKSLGGYYEYELKNQNGEVFTFIYKRTFHNSEGMSTKSDEVLERLRNCNPEGIATLKFEAE